MDSEKMNRIREEVNRYIAEHKWDPEWIAMENETAGNPVRIYVEDVLEIDPNWEVPERLKNDPLDILTGEELMDLPPKIKKALELD